MQLIRSYTKRITNVNAINFFGMKIMLFIEVIVLFVKLLIHIVLKTLKKIKCHPPKSFDLPKELVDNIKKCYSFDNVTML